MINLAKTCYNDNMHERVNKRGFTLVELSLSLVFIAILSVAVVLVMTGAISSYHRSITLNKVESVGSGLVRDMKTSIQAASVKSLKMMCEESYPNGDSGKDKCITDNGKNLVTVTRYESVTIGNTTKNSVPVFGAVCTGNYSYIWNSGYFFDDNYKIANNVQPVRLKYKTADNASPKDYPDSGGKPFKLLKVRDKMRKVCEASFRVVGNSVRSGRYKIQPQSSIKIASDGTINMAALISTDEGEEPTEYLMSSDNNDSNLAIYNMSASVSEQTGVVKNAYYYASFIMGTVQGGINIMSTGNFCTPPEGADSELENMDYCAINKFNFAALATGG